MKGDVKKNTSPIAGDRNEIQPALRYGAAVFVLRVHRDSESTADLPGATSRAIATANHGSI
jgi:hypothetical protein